VKYKTCLYFGCLLLLSSCLEQNKNDSKIENDSSFKQNQSGVSLPGSSSSITMSLQEVKEGSKLPRASTDFQMKACDFSQDGVAGCVGNFLSRDGAEKMAVYYSFDSGESWEPPLVMNGKSVGLSIVTKSGVSYSVISSDLGFFVGSNQGLFKKAIVTMSDGTSVNNFEYKYSVILFPSGVGYSAARDVGKNKYILLTKDFGLSWQAKPMPETDTLEAPQQLGLPSNGLDFGNIDRENVLDTSDIDNNSQLSGAASASASSNPTTTLSTAVRQVVIDQFSFPQNLTVPLGTTIKWVNQDGAPHTVTLSMNNPIDASHVNRPPTASDFDSGNLSPGGGTQSVFEFRPTVIGVYNYECSFHSGSGMIGSFTVTE
jgi:plastocyanin